jgi:hypothetical protein
MIYVYGIVDKPDLDLAAQPGLDDAPVEVLAVRNIAALGSFHTSLAPEARLDSLRQHHRVVEAAMAGGTVVPARFGTLFADRYALDEVLTERRDQLAPLLRELSGKVELALRARVCAAPGAGGGAPDELLDRMFGTLARQSVSYVFSRRGPGTRCAAYLVAKDDVPSFQQSTARLMGGHPTVQASLTGPWPPYSFTDVAAATGLGSTDG